MTRKTLGFSIMAVGAIAVATAVVYGLLTQPPPAPANTLAPPTTSPEQPLKGNLTVEGAQVSKTDAQGNPVWSLAAGSKVTMDPERKQAQGTDVHWSLQGAGKTAWTVDAPTLTIDYTTGKLYFSDGVKVASADGKQEATVARLTYEPDTKLLVGTGGAEFRSQKAVVTGERIVVDTQAKQVKLSGGVRAHVGP